MDIRGVATARYLTFHIKLDLMSPLHYKPKHVSEVNLRDYRIALIGRVISVGKNSLILDDDSGKIEIFSDFDVQKNKLVRVFCSMVDEKLKADIIQDLEKLDLNLFKKVKELYNSSSV